MSEPDQGLAEAIQAAPAVRDHRAAVRPAGGRAPDPGHAAPETMHPPADDSELAALVARSQSGDRTAFEELVRRTARLLYARLYLEAGDPHKAEDLVQETYMVAWRSIRQVTEPAGFRSWLLSVAHSVVVDAGRREGRKKRAGPKAGGDPAELIAGVSDPSPGPPEAAVCDEQRRRVLDLLRSMPDEYRLPLTLRYLAGADYETIGRQLGLSNGSLRGQLNRGMARLREMMTP